MLTLNLAIAGALGHDSFLDFPVHGPFRTVVFQKEIDRFGVWERARGMYATLGCERTWGRILHNKSRAVRLSDPATFASFLAYLRATKPDLVILDPFAHVVTAHENDNAEVGVIMDRLGQLRDDPGCALLVVHHNRKSSEATKSAAPNEDARGADRLAADSDTILSLRSAARNTLGPASRFYVLQRHGISPEPFTAVFNQRTLWWERICERADVVKVANLVGKVAGDVKSRDELIEVIEADMNLIDPTHHRSAKRHIKKAIEAGLLLPMGDKLTRSEKEMKL